MSPAARYRPRRHIPHPLPAEPLMRTLSLGIMALGLIAAVPPAAQQASVEVAIGKSVASGMPVDTASSFGADVGQIAGWTRVNGVAAGSKITHLWIHGADSSRVELNIGG